MSGPTFQFRAAAAPLRVLRVGPLPATAAGLPAALREAGAAQIACEPDEALQFVRLDAPDVVLLDPTRVESWRAALAIRRAGHDIGIVLLADAEVPCDRVETWLDQADDCLLGRVWPRQVIAHCRAVDRRRRGHATGLLEVRGVGVDQRTGDVLVGDHRVHFPTTERCFLAALLRRAGTVVRRESLMMDLYGDGEWPEPKILDVYLSKTRPDRPMWCDAFDADLPKVLPEAREIVGDIADVVLWTTGHTTRGVLNHPNTWNGHRTMEAFFGFGGPRRLAGYVCSGTVVRCTAWEAIRDAWPHSYTIHIEMQPVWDAFALRPELKTLIAMARGWADQAQHARDAERARQVVRASLRMAMVRFRHLVDTHPADVRRFDPVNPEGVAR